MALITLQDAITTLVLTSVGLAGTWWDVKYRRIPNLLCLTTAAGGLVLALLAGGDSLLSSHGAHFALILVGGMALYAGRIIGAGDAKYAAAAAAWFSLGDSPWLLACIALCCIPLSLGSMIRAKSPKVTGKEPGSNPRFMLPFGTAIAAGSVIASIVLAVR